MSKIDFYQKNKWGRDRTTLFHREKTSIDLLLPLMKNTFNFLDVGCGNGAFLKEISERKNSGKFTGIDNSDFQLEIAKKKNPSLEFKKIDLEHQWKLKENSFDFIYAAEILEHVHDPDSFLIETNRVLKRSGLAVITMPNLHAWFNRLIFPLGIQPIFYETSTQSTLIGSGILKKMKNNTIPVGHVRIFGIHAIQDLLSAYGFEIIKIKGTVFDSGFKNYKPILYIDKLFSILPSISAGFVILAKKIKDCA